MVLGRSLQTRILNVRFVFSNGAPVEPFLALDKRPEVSGRCTSEVVNDLYK